MMVEERVLGFDVRSMWPEGADLWSAERRQTYLLRSDLRQPLSVDTMVWDTMSDVDEALEHWRGRVQNLWEDLDEMKDFASQKALDAESWWPIAITVLLSGLADEQRWDGFGITTPISDLQVQRLGYDVADRFLLSGLSNCRYRDTERDELVSAWAHRLNEWHLFDDSSEAFAFRSIANLRVTEHAPFFMFGIYRLTSH